MQPLLASIYVLGALTLISFIAFIIQLFVYIASSRSPGAGAPPAQVHRDMVQALEADKVIEAIGKAAEGIGKLNDSFNKARPLAITATLTLVFLIGWLITLSFYVALQLKGA
jgi:hypothetical protein